MSLTRMRSDPHWHVREGEPPLIGYVLVDDNGKPLGTVEDLVVDTSQHKAPFIIVAVTAGERAGKRLIIPLRTLHIEAEQRRLVCHHCTTGDQAAHIEDTGGDLAEILKPKVVATGLLNLDERPELPKGRPGTFVATDARIQEELHPSQYCEKVDFVRMWDASGHSHVEPPPSPTCPPGAAPG